MSLGDTKIVCWSPGLQLHPHLHHRQDEHVHGLQLQDKLGNVGTEANLMLSF